MFREISINSEDEIFRYDALIDKFQSRDFFRIAYSQLQKIRKENFDVSMPITYHVSGCEKEDIEEQFVTYFLALERLKDLFIQNKPVLKEIIPDDQFEELKKNIKKTIKENIESSDMRAEIYLKIEELKRPAFRTILDMLFEQYNVKWEDLYPTQSKLSIIETRNGLFHSNKKLNFEFLVLETYRLRSIVERLLLSILGWSDFSRAPDFYLKKWIATSNKR